MLLFDAATLVVLFFYLVTQLSERLEQWRLPVFLFLAMILVCHLLTDGLRWQLVPMYSALAVAAVCQVAPLGRSWVKGLSVFALLIAPLSAVASWAFPIFDVPEPTGQYAVGTTKFTVVDDSRRDVFASIPGPRRLTMRVWYPAEATDKRRTPYWRAASLRSEKTLASTPLPWFTFTHLGKVHTNSVWDANPVSESAYPVIIYSHGIGLGWSSGNTALVEELASHGYVVLAIGHAGIGSATIFNAEAGDVEVFDAATAEAMAIPPSEEIMALREEMQASQDWQKQVELYAKGMTLMDPRPLTAVTHAMNVMVDDQRFVMDQLANWSQLTSLSIDSTRIGLIGMSLGGCAVVMNCADNEACAAGVNLDGFHPDQIGVGSVAPMLFMNTGGVLFSHSNFNATEQPAYSVTIPDVTHFNFFDFTIMSPLYKIMGVLGEIDGERMVDITRGYAVTFYDRHLKGRDSDFELGFDEVDFQAANVN